MAGSCQRPNRSLKLTPPRAEFFVRKEVVLSPMLIVTKFCGHNTKNVNATAVHNACLPKWVVQHFNKTKWSARRQGRRSPSAFRRTRSRSDAKHRTELGPNR